MRRTFPYLTLSIVLATGLAHAAPAPRATSGSGMRVPASLSGGYATHSIRSPQQNFSLSPGIYLSAEVERSLGFLGLYINLGVSHTTANGLSDYRYTNTQAQTYYGSNLDFRMTQTQITPGLKLKFFDESFFRPYVGAGGVIGQYTMEFVNTGSRITGPDRAMKLKEEVGDFGGYAEAGIEIWFGSKVGFRGAGRIVRGHTREITLINQQTIAYDSEIYFASLSTVF